MIKLTRKLSALVFGLAVSFSPVAFAADVGPGTVVAVSGTTVAADSTLAGLVLYDQVLPFSITLATGGFISGTFQDRVVQNTLGTLDFYARINSDSSSEGGVTAFLRAYFNNYPGTGSTASMDYRTDGLGSSVAPLWATRSADSSGAGFYFDSTNGIAAGEGSFFMFYRTTATEFDVKGIGYVAHYNGNGSNNPYDYSNFLTLAQPVPEPETYALLMAGLGLIGAVARRRKNS